MPVSIYQAQIPLTPWGPSKA